VLATLDTVLPYADHPGMRAALVALGEVARKQDGDAHWLRQQHQARGSLSQVVRLACEQWAAQ
jgi:gamma-glutamyl:cysteine ligase YbdK (ATP-grasp superfamily)